MLGVKRLLPDGKTTADLVDSTTYNVASTSYILSGGDEYDSFADPEFLYPSGDPVDEIMAADLTATMPDAVSGCVVDWSSVCAIWWQSDEFGVG